MPGRSRSLYHLLLGLEPQENYIWTGQLLQPALLGAVADHHQPPLGQLSECLHEQFDALIRHQPRNAEIEILAIRSRAERVRIHGRIDHRRRPAIRFLNPPGDELRIRDEAVHSVRASHIPLAELVQAMPAPATAADSSPARCRDTRSERPRHSGQGCARSSRAVDRGR